MRKVLRFFYNTEFVVGLLILIITFLLLYLDHPVYSLAVSWFGYALIIDFLNKKINQHSYFPINQSRFNDLKNIFICALIFCFIIEFFGVYTLRAWYYPHMSALKYFILAPGAFFIYSFVLLSLYDIIKSKLSFFAPRGRTEDWKKAFYKKLIKIELILGFIGLATAFFYSLIMVSKFNIAFFDFTKSTNIPFSWWQMFLVGFSFFFIFEYIAFKQHKETLTKDIVISGNYIPLIAILIANFIAVVIFEFPNGPLQIWRFDNWFLNDLRFLNIPLFAFIAWPFQFLIFLPLLRIAFRSKDIDIW
jgi:hypothetical protein